MLSKEIKKSFRLSLILGLMIIGVSAYSQVNTADLGNLKPDPKKEIMFKPYLAVRHGGPEGLEVWKKDNVVQYYRELWYFCESFYVKRNHLPEGAVLNEEIIDISRFESSRKEYDEAIVILPGFKDVLVLVPTYKLIYKLK